MSDIYNENQEPDVTPGESIPSTPLEPAIPNRPPRPPHHRPPVCPPPPCPPPIPGCPPTPPGCIPPPPPVPPVGCCPPPQRPDGRRHKPLWCGPADTTRPGDFYDVSIGRECCPPIPPTGYDIKPLTPYVPGLNVEKQMEYLYSNMNHLIDIFNQANQKVFGAYQAVVNSATCNNAYYNEITTEQGFFPSSQVAYKVTHIPFLDASCQPIYFELGLPNNTTVNDGTTENCYNASLRTLADKLIPATQSGEKWKGWVLQKGKQINCPQPPVIREGEDKYYIFGVSENGFMKWYPSDVSIRTLNVERVRNCMNVSAVLCNNQVATPELFSSVAEHTLGRVAVGMNYDTKERFIIVVDGSEQTGCTESELASLFVKYGCHVAVQTAYSTSSFGMNKGLMMFEPSTVDSDQTPTMPAVSGFWYITKRRHYHNAFVKEIAELTQLMGEQIWYDWINADSIDYVKDRIVYLLSQLEQEGQDRVEADNELRLAIDAIKVDQVKEVITDLVGTTMRRYIIKTQGGDDIEVPIITYDYERLNETLTTYGSFEERLNAEIENRKTEDDKLQTNIDNVMQALREETQQRIEEDRRLNDMFTDPNSAINVLIRQVETTLQNAINKEVADRISGDNQLRNDLNAEIGDRASEDSKIQTSLNNFKLEYQTFVSSTTADINRLQNAITDLTDTTTSEITYIKGVLTQHGNDITTLNSQYSDMTNRIASINAAVTALQGAFNTLETSYDNLKEAFATMEGNFHTLQDDFTSLQALLQELPEEIRTKIENGAWLKKVNVTSASGNFTATMEPDREGIIFSKTVDGVKTNLEVKTANPTTPESAVNMNTLDTEIAQAIADANAYTDSISGGITGDLTGYVKKTGSTMSGNLTMDGATVKGLPNPTDDADAANKAYVDQLAAGATKDALPLVAGEDNPLRGDLYMDGHRVVGVGAPEADTDAVNLGTANQLISSEITRVSGNFLSITGGTLKGDLVMSNVPTDTEGDEAGQAADAERLSESTIYSLADGNTEYVEMHAYHNNNEKVLELNTESAGERVRMRGVKAPEGPTDVVPNDYLEEKLAGFSPEGSLPLNGGTMQGGINMDGNQVSNLPDAINDGDAVSKGYLNQLMGEAAIEWGNLQIINPDDEFIEQWTAPSDGILLIRLSGASPNDRVYASSDDLPEVGFSSNNSAGFVGSDGVVPVKKGKTYTFARSEGVTTVSIRFYPFAPQPVLIEANLHPGKGYVKWGKWVEVTNNDVSVINYTVEKDGLMQVIIKAATNNQGNIQILNDVGNVLTVSTALGITGTTSTGLSSVGTLAVQAGETLTIRYFQVTEFNISITEFDELDVLVDGNFVKSTGDTITGPIDMGASESIGNIRSLMSFASFGDISSGEDINETKYLSGVTNTSKTIIFPYLYMVFTLPPNVEITNHRNMFAMLLKDDGSGYSYTGFVTSESSFVRSYESKGMVIFKLTEEDAAAFMEKLSKIPFIGGDLKPDTPPVLYQITVENGTGSGKYEKDTTITIEANTKEGHHFSAWDDGNTDNPREITVLGEQSYTAQYEPNQHTIRVTNGSGSGTYNYGSNCTIAANAAPAGQRFSSWDTVTGSTPTTFVVKTDKTITARYASIPAGQPGSLGNAYIKPQNWSGGDYARHWFATSSFNFPTHMKLSSTEDSFVYYSNKSDARTRIRGRGGWVAVTRPTTEGQSVSIPLPAYADRDPGYGSSGTLWKTGNFDLRLKCALLKASSSIAQRYDFTVYIYTGHGAYGIFYIDCKW